MVLVNKSLKNEPVKKKKKQENNENNENVRKTKKAKTKLNKNKIHSIKHKKRLTNYKINKPEIKNYFIYNEIGNSSYDNNKQSINRLNSNSNEGINKYKISSQFNIEKEKLSNKKQENDINLEEYLKTDLDDLDYEDLIKKDKRKFCEYFYEKVKSNQIVLNTFCAIDHLRPRTIKIMLFILDIDLYFLVNGLFFNEEYVSEIFNSAKNENFFTFIPRSIDRFFYTTLVGVIVGYIIDFFFIEEKKIKRLFLREKDNIVILKYEISLIIKDIQKRNKWFIILSFFIIILTIYYVFCFNNIYPHMKNEWIKSSIIIIFVMQILSFLTCLLEAIIRFISFFCKSEKLYKISLLLS